MLTGHTLYNDTQVVVRELIQNSIDAIRLQRLIDREARNGQNQNDGQVVVTWDSSQRLLSVRDNGTGMTQDIIERHLLKVGSSRYQHEDFKRKYPNFSPISRFGIGLLSSFMIADEVEIITCHEEEEKARLLTLRSVHGKYLIQLVDKDDNSLQDILPHGTSIKLKVRQSADLDDILKIVRKWIVFPDCDVLVIEDDKPEVKVGFSSPKESLTAILTDLGVLGDSKRKKKIKVEERTINGLTLAYALECQDYFQDWEFLTFDMLKLGDDLIEDNPIKNYLRGDDLNENISREVNLGICVQGVRVEFGTPGLNRKSIIAIGNSQGSNAPKTNVARSGFEVTPGREKMLEAIYQIYCNHIKSEITELQKRQFSLTKAAEEAQYLLEPLIELSFKLDKATDFNLLNNAIEEIPFLIIEKDGSRSTISPQKLLSENSFWTIESRLFDLANILISEINSSISLSSLANTFYLDQKLYLPDSDLYFIVNYISSQRNEYLLRSIFENREVDRISVYSKEKRVDLRWVKTKKENKWYTFPPLLKEEIIKTYYKDFGFMKFKAIIEGKEMESFNIKEFPFELGINLIDLSGIDDELAVLACGIRFILPNNDLSNYLKTWLDKVRQKHQQKSQLAILILMMFEFIDQLLFSKKLGFLSIKELFSKMIDLKEFASNSSFLESEILTADFIRLAEKIRGKGFNPNASTREKDSFGRSWLAKYIK